MRYLFLLLFSPSLFAATITANFDLSDTATSYTLYEVQNGKGVEVATGPSSPLQYDSQAVSGQVYVTASNAAGESGPSNIASWNAPIVIQSPPGATTITITVE